MTLHTGRHFLQIPGPTNVPDRVLRAMDMPTLDHRGPEFAELGHAVLAGMQRIFRTKQPVIIYPASGSGAWEAAIVNTLAPGDRVLMVETGHFASLWRAMAERLGLQVDFVPGDWRHGVEPAEVAVIHHFEILADGRQQCAVGGVLGHLWAPVDHCVPKDRTEGPGMSLRNMLG